MRIKSLRVREVVFSHEGNNHIKNEGDISLKDAKGGVEMFNERRNVHVFIPSSNILWVVLEEPKVGRPRKESE